MAVLMQITHDGFLPPNRLGKEERCYRPNQAAQVVQSGDQALGEGLFERSIHVRSTTSESDRIRITHIRMIELLHKCTRADDSSHDTLVVSKAVRR
jgi:hypothetical protein